MTQKSDDRIRKVYSADPDRDMIRHLICKQCGSPISSGICGWGCPYDTTLEKDRPEHRMEYRVYEFAGYEPYVRKDYPTS